MKKLLLIVLAIVLAAGGYVSGWVAGHRSADRKSVRLSEHITNLNDVGSYITSAHISESFIVGEAAFAGCLSNLETTMYYRRVRTCLGQENCRSIILEEVQKNAPELLDDSKPRFKLTESCQGKPLPCGQLPSENGGTQACRP